MNDETLRLGGMLVAAFIMIGGVIYLSTTPITIYVDSGVVTDKFAGDKLFYLIIDDSRLYEVKLEQFALVKIGDFVTYTAGKPPLRSNEVITSIQKRGD